MFQPDALIFDCDGTLADTMPAHYEAWVATLSRYGIDFAEDRFYSWGGWPTRQVAATLLMEAGLSVDVEQIAVEKETAFRRVMNAIRPIEPVVSVARAHRGQRPLAVATGGVRYIIEPILQQIGILEWFQTIVTSDDVTRHKPEPDVYIEAARRLGVRPERCLAYEDTEPGLEAARRAGMTCIDVRTLYTPRRVTPLGVPKTQ
jgi:beta-phosphoglucomutase family hydrolase